MGNIIKQYVGLHFMPLEFLLQINYSDVNIINILYGNQ